LAGSSFASRASFLPALPAAGAIRRFSATADLLKPADKSASRRSHRRSSVHWHGGCIAPQAYSKKQKKESAMHTSSSSSRQELARGTRRQTSSRPSGSKSRTSIHFEDAVAMISLTALSTTVLALIYQSMVL
jgi:hypothetical protein